MKGSRSVSFAVILGTIITASVVSIHAQQIELFPIRQNGKTGLADRTGRIVIPPQFDVVTLDENYGFLSEGLGRVENGGKCGYIDAAGAQIIKPQFDSCFSFRNGL